MKFHGDAAGLDDVGDYDSDDEEKSDGMNFMISAKIMKESMITAIIQANTGRLHTVCAV